MVTPVAILGTLADFTGYPIPYNFQPLVRLVQRIHPDFLCLDITSEQWLQGDFQALPAEYQKGLLPLAYQTDMVVVPIAGERRSPGDIFTGWRGEALMQARTLLGHLQRALPGELAAHPELRPWAVRLLSRLSSTLAGNTMRRRWKQQASFFAQAVLDLVRRDPGCRVLVVVGVRYVSYLHKTLQNYPEIKLVSTRDL